MDDNENVEVIKKTKVKKKLWKTIAKGLLIFCSNIYRIGYVGFRVWLY